MALKYNDSMSVQFWQNYSSAMRAFFKTLPDDVHWSELKEDGDLKESLMLILDVVDQNKKLD